jgi:tetratricopeptide (TPR) repeat protein
MLRFTFMLCFVLTILQSELHAQENPILDTLRSRLQRASTSEAKVGILGELAVYFVGADRKLSDVYSTQQFAIAEESRDRKLIIRAHLWNAQRLYNMNVLQRNIIDGLQASEKALALAKASHLAEMEAWANMYVAQGLRLNSQYDKALNHNNLAISIATTLDNDSLKVFVYSSIGNTYMRKKDKMLAFRNYLEAMNVAERADKFTLLKNSYQNIAGFYSSLDDYERAKDYLYKVLATTKRFNKRIDRLETYNAIGRVYAQAKQYDLAMTFYDRALALADTLSFDLIKLNTYSSITDMYLNSNQWARGLAYLKSKPQLRAFVDNAGFSHNIDQAYGAVYVSLNKLDSAEFYFKRAEPGFQKVGSKQSIFWFYGNVASLYTKKGDYKKALAYSLRAKEISDAIGDLELMRASAQDLDSVYQRLGDFKSAYAYNRQYYVYKDSLEKLSTEKDLLLMEVENENKRKERDAQLEEQHTRDRHNIQYMGITAAIAGVFIVLVMLGIFSVSHATIRVLGFFAFIFLFEFLILIADNQIHHWTHGEPWKILAIKIGLISVLLPLHHYLEEKVIHYLTSRKLLVINKEALLGKFLVKKEVEQ